MAPQPGRRGCAHGAGPAAIGAALHWLVVAGLLLPLGVDTFAIAAALGVAGLAGTARRRASLVMAIFEAGMPVVGVVVGTAAGVVAGRLAGWIAIALLVTAGVLMLRRDEEGEEDRVRSLASMHGLALVTVGLSVSIDELAVGLSLGLAGIPLALGVAWIAVQALVAAEAGMRLGGRVGERIREGAERLAGLALIAVAALLLALRLAGVEA